MYFYQDLIGYQLYKAENSFVQDAMDIRVSQVWV